ncbi:MAG: hypothetical protein E4H01_07355 [Lysobacterales bacterium]|nr:MAG: hypothetical protein E4H01_07355 [Xanthomonadales bacterium]
MALTPAQLITLKADILADPTLSALPNNSDSSFEIARVYNLAATPEFILWRKSVGISEVGRAMRNSDIANLTTANNARLQTLSMYSGDIFDASNTDTRQGFDDIFSVAGAAPTRAALLVIWKRSASRAEKLFATGPGTDALPAISVFADGFSLGLNDVSSARNLP